MAATTTRKAPRLIAPAESPLKGASYEGFILGLSLLSLANLVYVALFPARPTAEILRTVEVGLSIIFLLDFAFRLLSAPRWQRYLLHQFGWLDFIGSLPFPPLRVARVYRIVAVVRAYGPLRGRLWRRIVLARRSAPCCSWSYCCWRLPAR